TLALGDEVDAQLRAAPLEVPSELQPSTEAGFHDAIAQELHVVAALGRAHPGPPIVCVLLRDAVDDVIAVPGRATAAAPARAGGGSRVGPGRRRGGLEDLGRGPRADHLAVAAA